MDGARFFEIQRNLSLAVHLLKYRFKFHHQTEPTKRGEFGWNRVRSWCFPDDSVGAPTLSARGM
ncbi:unnamed protein product, partial [Dibothriocephalus latus]